MRKFIFNLFAAILAFGIFYIFAVAALGTLPFKNLNYRLGAYGHLFTRVKEIDSVKKVDILFLGSSHSYRGFDPRIFKQYGLTSFNLGSSSQTPIQAKILLEKYLDKLKPELVIYELSPMTLSNDGIESSLDVIANDELSMPVAKMAFELNHIKTYNSLLYAKIRQMLPFKPYHEPMQVGKDTYIKGGYVERKMDYFKKYVKNGNVDKRTKFEHLQIENLNAIIDFLRAKHIKLIFVQTPVTAAYSDTQKSMNASFDSLMRKSGQQYYNFNKLVPLDDSLHFYDLHHLCKYP